MLPRLFIAALWSLAGKGLTSWLLFVVFSCDFVTFLCGILGQVWYLIVLIPDLCRLSYFSRTHHEAHFCEFMLKFSQWLRRRWRLKIFIFLFLGKF